jgi:hypothetical protein
MLPADRCDSPRHFDPLRRSGMTATKEAETACWHWLIGHQPKSPIERGEPLDMLGRLPGAANDHQLVWPLVPFPEDW